MNNYQESKLSMYLASRDFMGDNVAILDPLPNFQENYRGFQDTIIQIQQSGKLQNFSKTGIAATKNEQKQELITLAVDTARRTTAYAKFGKNNTLLNEVNYSESDLKRCADTNLCSVAQGIHDRAQTNIDALAAYGVTPDTQSALANAISAFNSSIPKPRLGITEKKQSTEQLSRLFKVADTYLGNIDTLVEIVRLSQVNFYNGYRAARKLVQTGIGSLSLKGTITDAQNGEPLKGVTLRFVSSDGIEPFEKITAEKGGFIAKTIPEGTYQVTASKEGYKEKIMTVSVTDGEMTKVDLKLEKN